MHKQRQLLLYTITIEYNVTLGYNTVTRLNQPPHNTTKGQVHNMKVKLTQEMKKYITIAQAPIVREMIADFKEDKSTVKEYAEMTVMAACNGKAYSIEVLKASAEIAKNCRAWNVYSDHSEDIDIWIEATVYVNGDEFVIIGAYLSDIWQMAGDNYQEIASNMYIRKFEEVK